MYTLEEILDFYNGYQIYLVNHSIHYKYISPLTFKEYLIQKITHDEINSYIYETING